MHARAGRATGAAHWPTGGFPCAPVARVHAAPGQRLVGPLVNSVASLCQVCSFGSRPVDFVCLQARRRGDGPSPRPAGWSRCALRHLGGAGGKQAGQKRPFFSGGAFGPDLSFILYWIGVTVALAKVSIETNPLTKVTYDICACQRTTTSTD